MTQYGLTADRHWKLGLLLVPLILGLALPNGWFNHYSQHSDIGFPLGFPKSSRESVPSASLVSAATYDEQVGVTFTQNFSKLGFNVTAVAFTSVDNVGPGYLVNGLTEAGYWYQVGLSYNWPLTSGRVNPGFSMNYEVFDSSGYSIDPPNGGGGLQSLNGPVNAGDIVFLGLDFSSAGVVMRAMDWQTGAVSSHSYSAHGSIFIGLNSSLSQMGFFTGLMTEQYHSSPYYGAGSPVAYNESGVSLASVWMWMDEWNTDPNNYQSIFKDNTTLVKLDSSLGRYFASNGTAEVANAHGLVTGLTPVTFPTLTAGPSSTGRPGSQASVVIVISDPDGATVRFENLTISTGFGKYNFSLGVPFSLTSGSRNYIVTMELPATLALGNYNLTVNVSSWQYLDAQAQEWISLQQASLNETLLVINNPPPPPNPPSSSGPSPPSSGQGPSTSTNKTTRSSSSLLAVFGSVIIPVSAGYAALVLLALVLLIRHQRKRFTDGQILTLRFCQTCGTGLIPGMSTCPSCDPSTNTMTSSENLGSVTPNSS